MIMVSLAERIRTKTLLMGVLNASPDSFYAPSAAQSLEEAVEKAKSLIDAGADILDIGGESSRPGAEPVDLECELSRVLPVLDALRESSVTKSIDTYRAETARRAVALGATMINDITALRGDPEMRGVVAESGADCVLMHMQGLPKTMQRDPQYENVVDEIKNFFEERIAYATAGGIPEDRLWLDPGFGFGKTVANNLSILRHLSEFKQFGLPLMIGTSNKSTIGAVLDAPIDARGEGTAATVAIAIWNGADCVRVHDVKAMARVAAMSDAIAGGTSFG